MTLLYSEVMYHLCCGHSDGNRKAKMLLLDNNQVKHEYIHINQNDWIEVP
jgi:hypothetical protein